jgi:hypothetical protein
MNTILKPFEIIASRFQISKESAKYFLVQVQKSFKKDKPPTQLIIDSMKGRKYKTMPSPWQVAKKMSDSGLWTYPMNAEPAALEDEKDRYFPS